MLSSLFNEFLPMKNLIYLGIVSILYHCYFQILYHLVELFAHDLIYVQLAIELYKHYSVTHEMVSITFDLSILSSIYPLFYMSCGRRADPPVDV